MKKELFIVPILSLIGGLIFRPLVSRIIVWITNIMTPNSQMIQTANDVYTICIACFIFIILVGVILRKKKFDRMTIFKSATILVVYILIIYVANELYFKFVNAETPSIWLGILLHYPFSIYEIFGDILRNVGINEFVINILVILYPYVFVLFGTGNRKTDL